MNSTDLKTIAHILINLDFDQLADAGVLERGSDGRPAEGGSSWERFNRDPLMFILKLPDDKLDALVRLINKFGGPRSTVEMVDEWHTLFELPKRTLGSLAPGNLPVHLKLVDEEHKELVKAVQSRDLAATLKEACDLQYVLDGTFVELGIAHLKQPAFIEVHRSNLSKIGDDGKPHFNENGKVIKGNNYKKADLSTLIEGEVMYG